MSQLNYPSVKDENVLQYLSQNKPRRKAEFGPLGLVVVNLGLVLHLLSQDSDLVVAQALNRAPVLDGILSDEDVRHLERVLPVVVVVVMKAAAPLVSFKGVVVVVDVVDLAPLDQLRKQAGKGWGVFVRDIKLAWKENEKSVSFQLNILILLSAKELPIISATRCWNKSSPNMSKSCQKVATAVITSKSTVFKKPKWSLNIWASFKGKFVDKNFEKSPNLVTLPIIYFLIYKECFSKVFNKLLKPFYSNWLHSNQFSSWKAVKRCSLD